MAGYSRQSAADIIANAIIKAAPVNAEYNALRDAFAFSGGHKHDGSSTEGAYIPLIADVDAFNKVVIDTTNNRIGFFSEVGGAAVEQVRIQDGAIVPVTDDDIDLGATGAEFKDLYIDGVGYIDTLTVHENATIAGTLNVTGVITAPGGLVADITGDITGNVTGDLTGDVTSTGTSTFADIDAVDLAATGTTVITSGDINSGTIDNSVIGSATPAAGTFTTLNANTSLTAATADINGGTVDGTTIGATTPSTGAFTALSATGTSTLTTVDINGGAIDGTVIGASSAAAGSFTTVSTSGQATLATVDINGGSIDGAIIGASTPAAITGTTVTGTSFVGPVTGNVTGNLTGNVTGDVTGDLTGNVTASSGSSTFNNVVIDGTLNMNAGTTATIQNLTAPVNDLDAATKKYVDDEVAGLVDSAPGTLDTLNELAAALGDDADFSNTVTTSIATKLPLAGGTMTGAIAMGTSKITGLGDPTAAQDAASKNYADTTFLSLSGGTMTGAIDMGSQKITTTYTPTNAADLTTKTYVDAILGSGSDAAASAAAAATSETNAATSETNAATSETNAATSEANAAASYDNFDDRYLGAKSSAPTLDNDGDALIVGALYFNNTTNIMYVYGSGGWQAAGSSVNGTSDRNTYTATAGQTVFAATYDTGYVDVYLNGVKLVAGTDFTATNGTSITLATGAAVNDVVDIVAYGTFVLADHYTEAQSDARYVQVAGDTMTGALTVGGTVTADGLTVDNGSSGQSKITISEGGADNRNLVLYSPATSGTNAKIAVEGTTSNLDFVVNNGAQTAIRIGGATGDISFYEDTGTTPKFFWDASAERLAVGGTATNATLHVHGNSVISNGNFFSIQSSSGLSPELDEASNGWAFTTNGTERMRINSSGNVGIGTSSPTNTSGLEIQTSSTTAGLWVQTGGTTSSYNIAEFRTGSNLDALKIRGDGSSIFQGNVGIGESSVDSKFHVKDSLASTGVGSSSSPIAIIQNERTNTGTSSSVLRFDTNEIAGTQQHERAAIGAEYDGSANVNGRLMFSTADTSGNLQERMRLDSSGNLLVGKTATGGNVAGMQIINGSFFSYVRDGGVVQVLNRKSSDGDILSFEKDNSTVGSIGSGNSGLGMYISAPNSGGAGLFFNDNASVIYPTKNVSGTNTLTDDHVTLGASTLRFKDLYLSGGVFLGGTGSANKLDDYEEGTWSVAVTPSTSGSITITGGAFYTKVGQIVNINISLNSTGISSPVGYIDVTLPFAAATGSQKGRSALSLYFDGIAAGHNTADFVGLTIDGTSNIRIYLGDGPGNASDSAQAIDGDSYMLISGTYITSA